MSASRRYALVGAFIVAAIVALVIIQPGTSSKSSNGVVHIEVRNGKPVGGVKTISVGKGKPVRFTVTSDVADEIHVHGYNFHKDVSAGRSVSFDFPATIDGVFVVELESRSEQIASLEVQP